MSILCDIETSTMRRPRPELGGRPWKLYVCMYVYIYIYIYIYMCVCVCVCVCVRVCVCVCVVMSNVAYLANQQHQRIEYHLLFDANYSHIFELVMTSVPCIT